jgi:predicted dehydrogenase
MMRVRMGMVGGGEGAFIGEIHRAAARLDDEVELVCGAFSSNPDVGRRTGTRLGLPPDRVYSSWQDMLTRESSLPSEVRAEFISIVTPNDLHLPVAERALDCGFHVLSDKPATLSLSEARTLAAAVARSKRCYALTHTYLGYPLVAEARLRVLNGDIGKVRRVQVDYPQGWLTTALETSGNRQAQWRTDPQRAGIAGCIGDIGVHAFNLAEYVTNLRVGQVCADLTFTVPNRRLDDQASALLRFEGGAVGMLTASQVAAGEENDLSIRVYGETGGLIWSHRDPNSLQLLRVNGPQRTVRAGNNVADLHPSTRAQCRTPAGHPEGYIEAFANIYRSFAADVRNFTAVGVTTSLSSPATIEAALRGMAFIEAMVASSAAGQQWVAVAPQSP